MAEGKTEVKKKGKFNVRKYVSPAFLVVLLISFSMWYLTKLSHDYTAEIPVRITIDDNRIKVMCMAQGSGYRLLSHRILHKSNLLLDPRDLDITPSAVNPGYYVVSPSSLQQAITLANKDINIITIGDIPEIKLDGEL